MTRYIEALPLSENQENRVDNRQAYLNESWNLEELLKRLRKVQRAEDSSYRVFGEVEDPVDLDDLPKFGGDAPAEIKDVRVLSWDENYALVSLLSGCICKLKRGSKT